LKELRTGGSIEIYMSSNCRGEEEVRKYSKINETPLHELPITNKELGVLCKKPFSVSVLCFKK
jgi:ribosomal protein L30E